jgi:two-component sensor histidine kinase
VLSVGDDGPGFPSDFSTDAVKTLGMLLLRSLARQLNGVVLFSSQPTRATLRFPLPADEAQ